MSWSSITEVELELLVAEGMAAMEPPVSRLWSLLQIRPAKWQLPPWGDEGGGFWVVGIIGNWVVWYNDIEDGFNVSRYDTPGVIAEYYCNHDKLQYTIHSLWRGFTTGQMPAALGPPNAFELHAEQNAAADRGNRE
jgi:hypothetical protein